MKVFLVVAVLIGAAVALMSIRVILRRGRFSSQHIGESKAMRDRGISCAASTDRRDRRAADKRLDLKEL